MLYKHRTATLWIAALPAALSVAPSVLHGARKEGPSIKFDDFSSGKSLTVNDAAKLTGEGDKPAKALRVTPSEESVAGSAFFTEKVSLKQGFETTFRFQISDIKDGVGDAKNPGGDGFAFVIQNEGPKALGSVGSGLGYGLSDTEGGIKNSLAVEFDTFDLRDLGVEGEETFHDPNGNHVSVHSRGPEPNHVDEDYSLGKVSEGLPNFKDGKPHTVKINYVPGTMKIYVDKMDKPALTLAIRLDKLSGKGFKDASVLDADGKAWVGFTAGTGGEMENHDILDWKLTPPEAGTSK